MNVYEAAIKRIEFAFNEFNYVYVSFSGGKDSGILLNLCIKYARKHHRKLGLFHMDYECQYSMTTDYVLKMEHDNADVLEVYHCCIPFKVTTCTSMYQSYWRPWEESKKDIWVRKMPEYSLSSADFPFFDETMWDYDFQDRFGQWLSEKKGCRICGMIGIRTSESLNRWRAIYSSRNYKKYKGKEWTKDMENGVINAYPIYDWKVDDVWIANGKFGWPYNKLYDLYYKAGLSISQMRVASPFINEGQDTLKLYKVIEPDTWGKMVGRVNGVNFTSIYGGTTAMGWKNLKIPEGYTWKQYMNFLLSTLPEKTRNGYLSKLEVSRKFWKEKGGVMSTDLIKKLKEHGVKFEIGKKTNYHTDKLPCRMDYLDDIDIPEFRDVPTYKRMCICIMKNDHLCKYMGFSETKNEMERRKNAVSKYKNILK